MQGEFVQPTTDEIRRDIKYAELRVRVEERKKKLLRLRWGFAQTPNNPVAIWRFHKPKQIANGVRVRLIGSSRFSVFKYELWIE